MNRVRLAASTVVVLAGLVPAALLLAASPPTRSAESLNAYIGYSRAGPEFVVDEFFPRFLRVAEGTTVTWIQVTPRAHGVTFLAGEPLPPESIPQPEDPSLPQMRNPKAEYPTLPAGPFDGSTYVNSGRSGMGDTFSVTFGKAGTYRFICIPHIVRDDMAVTVEVVPPGTPGITTQEDIDREVEADWSLFDRQAAAILEGRDGLAKASNPDGSTTWFVRVGTDQRSETDFRVGRMTVRAFLPSNLTIRVGDTVVWYTDTRVPVHTVTFPVQGGPPIAEWAPRLADGSLVPVEMLAPNGFYWGDPASLDWPRVINDPSFRIAARPSPVYDPTRYLNSGQLGDTDPTVGRAWSLTFNAPGTFEYVCLPHISLGMIGHVTVVG